MPSWSIKAGEDRTHLAIEILDKVISLSPRRAVAYLNMVDALEILVKVGGTEDANISLDEETIKKAQDKATMYRNNYQSLLSHERSH